MKSSLLLLLLAGVASAPAAAQYQATRDTTKARRDSAAARLPEIEVMGAFRPTAGPRVASGVPARISLLDGEQVDAWKPRILTEALASQPGISTYDDLGSPYKLNLSSRGFYASPVVGLPQGISVFLDGVRVNEPEAAQINFDLLPMEHIRRIEVLSGTSGLLGRNTLGGAVNLITARGKGPIGGELEASGGMYGAWRGDGSLSGSTADGWDYYVGGGYNREKGWRQFTSAEQYNGFVNIGKTGARSGIRFQAYHAHSYVQTAGSLPQSVFGVKPDSNFSANDYEDLSQWHLAVSAYRQVASASRVELNLFARRHNAERFNVNQRDNPDAFAQSRNRSIGGTLDYRTGIALGAGAQLALRFGADGAVTPVGIDLFLDSTKFSRTRTQQTRANSNGFDVAGFALADLVTGRLTLSGGGRVDYVRVPYTNALAPQYDTTSTFSRFSPRFGASVDLGHGLSVYGSWGKAFRAPAVLELACANPTTPCAIPYALGADPPLEPVVATTYEAGAAWAGEAVRLTASVYRTEVDNDIVLLPSGPDAPAGSTIAGYFANIPSTRRQGVEASVQWFPAWGGQFYANYAYTQATFQSSLAIFSPRIDPDLGVTNVAQPGSPIPLVPDHQLKAGGTVPLVAGLSLGADARYIGRQTLRGDEDGSGRKLNDYLVADARVSWSGGRWGVDAIVSNLTNNLYATYGTWNINQGNPLGPTLERFLTPGYARMFRVVIRRTFGGAQED